METQRVMWFFVGVMWTLTLCNAQPTTTAPAQTQPSASTLPLYVPRIYSDIWSQNMNRVSSPSESRQVLLSSVDLKLLRWSTTGCMMKEAVTLNSLNNNKNGFNQRQKTIFTRDSVQCNSQNITLQLLNDPTYEVPETGDVIEVTIASNTVSGGEGLPFNYSDFPLTFSIHKSPPLTSTVSESVWSMAYGVGSAATVVSGFIGHPTMTTVVPRALYLKTLATCGFETQFTIHTLQYWLRIPIGSSAFRYYQGAAVVNFITIFLVLSLHVVLIMAWAKFRWRVRVENRKLQEALDDETAGTTVVPISGGKKKKGESSKARRKKGQPTEAEIRAAFKKFDADGSGEIDGEEMYAAMQGLGFEHCTKEQVEEMVVAIDEDGNGLIDFEEFRNMMLNTEKGITVGQLRHTFKKFDADGSGEIDSDEMYAAMKGLGFTTVTKDQVAEMIRCVDADGNGLIDFDEFQNMMNIMSSAGGGAEQVSAILRDNRGPPTVGEVLDGSNFPANYIFVLILFGQVVTRSIVVVCWNATALMQRILMGLLTFPWLFLVALLMYAVIRVFPLFWDTEERPGCKTKPRWEWFILGVGKWVFKEPPAEEPSTKPEGDQPAPATTDEDKNSTGKKEGEEKNEKSEPEKEKEGKKDEPNKKEKDAEKHPDTHTQSEKTDTKIPSLPLTPEQRVAALYTHYGQAEKAAPEQLQATMEKYKGNEESLISALVKKYGPEPSVVAGEKDNKTTEEAKDTTKKRKPMIEVPRPLGQRIEAMYVHYVLPEGDKTEAPPAVVSKEKEEEGEPKKKEVTHDEPKFIPNDPKMVRTLVKASVKRYLGTKQEMLDDWVKQFGPEPLSRTVWVEDESSSSSDSDSGSSTSSSRASTAQSGGKEKGKSGKVEDSKKDAPATLGSFFSNKFSNFTAFPSSTLELTAKLASVQNLAGLGNPEAFYRRLGPVFKHYRKDREWFLLVEVLLSICIGLAEGIRTEKGCVPIAGIGILLGVIYLATLIALRPFIAPIDTIFFVFGATVLTLNPILLLVFHLERSLVWAETFASWLAVLWQFFSVVRMFALFYNAYLDFQSLGGSETKGAAEGAAQVEGDKHHPTRSVGAPYGTESRCAGYQRLEELSCVLVVPAEEANQRAKVEKMKRKREEEQRRRREKLEAAKREAERKEENALRAAALKKRLEQQQLDQEEALLLQHHQEEEFATLKKLDNPLQREWEERRRQGGQSNEGIWRQGFRKQRAAELHKFHGDDSGDELYEMRTRYKVGEEDHLAVIAALQRQASASSPQNSNLAPDQYQIEQAKALQLEQRRALLDPDERFKLKATILHELMIPPSNVATTSRKFTSSSPKVVGGKKSSSSRFESPYFQRLGLTAPVVVDLQDDLSSSSSSESTSPDNQSSSSSSSGSSSESSDLTPNEIADL